MRSRGFTLVELLVVTSIAAVLFGVALERFMRYQELGERVAVEQNIAAMNVALTMKFAAWITLGNPAGIEREIGKNPVNLLARPPENYLGELFAPDVRTLPKRSWYFDRETGEMVYLPHRRRYFSPIAEPPERLRFRVALTPGRNVPGEPRELPQPFIAVVAPFVWEIE